MSRVTIDDKAWPGVFYVAAQLGMKVREVSGILLSLYRTTQERELSSIPRNHFSKFAETWDLDEEQNERIIEALVFQDFLSTEIPSELIVVGNEKHIEGIRNTRSNARLNGRKGGRPRASSGKNEKSELVYIETDTGFENNQAAFKDNPTGSEKKPIQYNTLHFNSKQSSTSSEHSDSLFETADEVSIATAWELIVEPRTGRPSEKLDEKGLLELNNSIEQMPQMKSWIAYFYRLASSDWAIKRRNTFHFSTAIKWSNIEKEMRVISDSFSQEAANG